MIMLDFDTARKNKAQGVILVSRGSVKVTKGKITYTEKEQYIFYASTYTEARNTTRDLDWCNEIAERLKMKEVKYSQEYICMEAYSLKEKMKATTKREDINLGTLVPVRCFYRLNVTSKEYTKAGDKPKYEIKRLGVMEYANM